MSAKDEGYRIALEEQWAGFNEGGNPVGGCVVSNDGKVLGRGRNMRWVETLNDITMIQHANANFD